MLSSITLSLLPLLFSPALSFVLPRSSNSQDTFRIVDLGPLPAFLKTSNVHRDSSISIPNLQTLAGLDLTSLTSKNTIPLTRIQADSLISTSSNHLRRSIQATNPRSGTALLTSTGSSFLAPITLGTQTFNVVVDTGSSDTWLANSSFTCVDIATNRTQPPAACRFGPTYNVSKQGSNADDQFERVDNVNFNITYGDSEFLTGSFGTIDVSIAGIKVPDQRVALANLAAWQGDGMASGLLGLGFPALTGEYIGNDPRADRYCHTGETPGPGGCNQVEYDPLLTNAFFDSRVTTPVFSLALSRDESGSGNGGYLSIGGIPDLQKSKVEGGANAQFASAGLKMLKGDDKFRYYLVEVGGVVVGLAGSESSGSSGSVSGGNTGEVMRRWGPPRRSRRTSTSSTTTSTKISTPTTTKTATSTSQPTMLASSQGTPLIIDSGTTLSFLPAAQTRKIMTLFSPPAQYNPDAGFWFVSCTVTPPAVGITIGGRNFFFSAKDLVKKYNSSRCISGIQEASGGLQTLGVGILGDTWLDSVLAVFDFRNANKKGGGMFRVAARRQYSS